MSEHIQRQVLDNGLRLITTTMPDPNGLSIAAVVEAGPRQERARESGISHFIEHLVFKGTAGYSSEEINRHIDEMGGFMDAYTDREYTLFQFRVLHEHFPLALDILSELLWEPVFEPEGLERERSVVAEEIRAHRECSDAVAEDLLVQTLWGRHAIAKPVLGSPKSLRGLDRLMIKQYHQDRYHPRSVIVSVAGNLDGRETLASLTESFRSPRIEAPRRPPLSATPRIHGGLRTVERDGEQVHLLVGAAAPADGSGSYLAPRILNVVLGESSGSLLYRRLREERGLSYDVGSHYCGFRDCGFFAMYAAVAPSEVEETLKLIRGTITDLREKGIRREDFLRAKRYLRTQLLLTSDNASEISAALAMNEAMHRPLQTTDELVKDLELTSYQEVETVLARYFGAQSTAVAAVGPLDPESLATTA